MIDKINCDGEFKPIMNKVVDKLDISINYSNAQDHVPAAQRNNRMIKNSIRATMHRILYKRIPRMMIIELVSLSVEWLKWFPAKHRVSKYYSPLTIVTGKRL